MLARAARFPGRVLPFYQVCVGRDWPATTSGVAEGTYVTGRTSDTEAVTPEVRTCFSNKRLTGFILSFTDDFNTQRPGCFSQVVYFQPVAPHVPRHDTAPVRLVSERRIITMAFSLRGLALARLKTVGQ